MSVLPFASPVLGHDRTTPAVLLEIAQAVSSTLDLKELLDTLRPMATEKDLRLQLTDTEDPLIVYADRDKVSQILMNLIGNAIKFTPNGGQITVTARQVGSVECRVSSPGPDTDNPGPESPGTGERVEISVTDTGEGIPDKELPHIFDKFYQVQRGIQAKTKGTGLGLSIAKSLVELQGGCIRVASQVGQGSTFTFTLPRRPMAEIRDTETLGNAENIL